MFFSNLIALWLLVMIGQLDNVATAPINLGYKESFGLDSVQDFCRGEGRLDDLKDLAADIYRRKTGRFYVVSIIYTTPKSLFNIFVSFGNLFSRFEFAIFGATTTKFCKMGCWLVNTCVRAPKLCKMGCLLKKSKQATKK